MAEESDGIIEKKVEEYATFVSEVLKPDLQRSEARKRQVLEDINGYRELLTKLDDLKGRTTYTAEVDLAHETVFCPAEANQLEFVNVHVGMGFHVELSLKEAEAFSKKRIAFLQQQKLKRCEAVCAEVKDHIGKAQMILDQLSAELRK